MEECVTKDFYKAEIIKLLEAINDMPTLDLVYKILLSDL